MITTDFVSESVFGKASGISYKHENVTINGSDKDCARVCF